MDKCLVTKLSQVVNNNDLPIFGELKISINLSSQSYITVSSSKPQILTLSDNYKFPSTDTSVFELAAVSNKVVYLPLGQYTLKFEDKYSIKKLELKYTNTPTCKVNFADLEYVSELESLTNFILEGNLGLLPKSLKVLSSAGMQKDAYGDLSDFINLTTCSIASSNIEADITNWMNLGSINLSSSSNIRGELSDKPNITNLSMNKNSRFTWSPSSINSTAKLPMLYNVNVSDVNQCLKDLASRTSSAYNAGTTTFILYGDNFTPTDPAVNSAIETLKAANSITGKKEWSVKINDVLY